MKKTGIYIGAAIVLLALIYVGVAFFLSRTALAGTTVAGVDVSGKTAQEIPGILQTQLNDQVSQEIHVATTSGDSDTNIAPADAGVAVNYQASAQEVAGFTLNPVTLFERLQARTDHRVVLDVNESTLATAAKTVAGNLAHDPVDATLTFTDSDITVKDSQAGTAVDPEAVQNAIKDQWLSQPTVRVAETVSDPKVSTGDANDVKDTVMAALKEPLTLNVTGDVDAGAKLKVQPENIRKYGSFNKDLELEFDAKKFRTAVFDDNPDVGTEATNASFTLSGGKPQVVPSKDGISVDPDTLVTAVRQAVDADSHSADVQLSAQPADFSTEDAKKMDVSDVVSEFSTPYPSSPARDTNLKVAAASVSGTVLMPGEQFSLNKTLGPRTAAAGYKPAGVIASGQMQEDYGGGVSQISTTLFNAAYFAGFQLDEHQAHSRYISRYPEGRESTLDYKTIDLKFTNNSDTPVVMDMFLRDGKVWARMLGVKTVEVKSESSARYAFTSPGTMKSTGSTCSPQSPREGWSIKISRTITDIASGKVKATDSFITVYRPVNRVVCS